MFILHEKKSIVVIGTANSANAKTGPGIQIWILDKNMHPAESRQTGHDAQNQCRGCPLASNNGCYVNVNPLASIWRTWRAGKYSRLRRGSAAWTNFFAGQFVRFGAYGNPSLLPLAMLADIAGLAKTTTGYFHDWHLMTPARAMSYGKFLMASCESHNWRAAQAMGLRTFTAVANEPAPGMGIQCIADKTKNRIQCNACGLCDGSNRPRGKNIWIKAHGYQVRKALAAI